MAATRGWTMRSSVGATRWVSAPRPAGNARLAGCPERNTWRSCAGSGARGTPGRLRFGRVVWHDLVRGRGRDLAGVQSAAPADRIELPRLRGCDEIDPVHRYEGRRPDRRPGGVAEEGIDREAAAWERPAAEPHVHIERVVRHVRGSVSRTRNTRQTKLHTTVLDSLQPVSRLARRSLTEVRRPGPTEHGMRRGRGRW